jgi:hypothetical protein
MLSYGMRSCLGSWDLISVPAKQRRIGDDILVQGQGDEHVF